MEWGICQEILASSCRPTKLSHGFGRGKRPSFCVWKPVSNRSSGFAETPLSIGHSVAVANVRRHRNATGKRLPQAATLLSLGSTGGLTCLGYTKKSSAPIRKSWPCNLPFRRRYAFAAPKRLDAAIILRSRTPLAMPTACNSEEQTASDQTTTELSVAGWGDKTTRRIDGRAAFQKNGVARPATMFCS